ncbi:hypothetical protein BGZ63DRAFT_392696 [Mariannaea sp. PMI_226]|nr:hypothetical protein BGZ63DRAFT_392696 [Mariannaea sp. PMI_226]
MACIVPILLSLVVLQESERGTCPQQCRFAATLYFNTQDSRQAKKLGNVTTLVLPGEIIRPSSEYFDIRGRKDFTIR